MLASDSYSDLSLEPVELIQENEDEDYEEEEEGEEEEEDQPPMFTFALECPTTVRKFSDQPKPVCLLNKGQWYKVNYQLSPDASISERTQVKLRLSLTFLNEALASQYQVLLSKFHSRHPSDSLIEVRIPSADHSPIGEVHRQSQDPCLEVLVFNLPLPSPPSSTSNEPESLFFYVRLNAVATQFLCDIEANHPLKVPFDFALCTFLFIKDNQSMTHEVDFFPVKVTWPGRAEPLSRLIQSRYDRYQSVLKPPVESDSFSSTLSSVCKENTGSKMQYFLDLPAQVDPEDRLPVTYLSRSQKVHLKVKPLAHFGTDTLCRTTISLAHHHSTLRRSTSRGFSSFIEYINLHQRFVVHFGECRFVEAVFDAFYDQRSNSVEIIWIPAREIELCLHFEWLGALREEVAASKVSLVVQTKQWPDSGGQTTVEHVGCVVKFRDLKSSNPAISSIDGRVLAKSTQLVLSKKSNYNPAHIRRLEL